MNPLVRCWVAAGVEVARRLRPPVTADELVAFTSVIEDAMPLEVLTMHASFGGDLGPVTGAVDGGRTHLGLGMFFGLEWLSLDAVLEERARCPDRLEFSEAPQPGEPSEPFPSLAFLPVLTDGTGNFHGVDLRPTGCGQAG